MKAVIFDLDGTITNSEPLHMRTFNEILLGYGVKLNRKDFSEFKGESAREIFRQIFEKNNIKEDPISISKKRSNMFIELVKIEGLETIKGFKEFYKMLIDKKVKVIIGTSGMYPNVEQQLQSIGLEEQKFVCARDVKKLKPNPDIFLLAAKKLGEESSNCIVFEDAKAGVEAAHRAGMQVIGINQTSSLKDLEKADMIVEDYNDLSENQINELLDIK